MLAAKLAAETAALFAAPGWIERKSWHGGLAETSCLPGAAVRLAPPPKETADDPAVQAQRKKNKALKGEDGLARLADGLSFHQRATVVDPHRQKEAEGLKYEHFWNALAKDHIEHEKTYVDNFRDAVSLDRDGHHGKSWAPSPECMRPLAKPQARCPHRLIPHLRQWQADLPRPIHALQKLTSSCMTCPSQPRTVPSSPGWSSSTTLPTRTGSARSRCTRSRLSPRPSPRRRATRAAGLCRWRRSGSWVGAGCCGGARR